MGVKRAIFSSLLKLPAALAEGDPAGNYWRTPEKNKRCRNVTELTETDSGCGVWFLTIQKFWLLWFNLEYYYLCQTVPLTQRKKSEYSFISVTVYSAVSMPSYQYFENHISCLNKQDKADVLNLQAKALIRCVLDTLPIIGTEDVFWGNFLFLQPNKCCV